jgi:hypothetical protein
MEHEKLKRKKEVDIENISLNNQSTISPTTDQEMRDAHNSSNERNSSDE